VVSVRLVARGAGGATETLAVLASDQRFSSGKATAAYLSPDGKRALVVAGFETGAMCWDFQHLNVVAVDLPRRRASLANTIGFRAWKRGDMPAALAAFKESTRLDPSFGLGAFNRAAVESRTGDLAAAGQSFRTAVALDASAAARACKDHDFDALRAAEPALMACR
jgi:hypothetical protein